MGSPLACPSYGGGRFFRGVVICLLREMENNDSKDAVIHWELYHQAFRVPNMEVYTHLCKLYLRLMLRENPPPK